MSNGLNLQIQVDDRTKENVVAFYNYNLVGLQYVYVVLNWISKSMVKGWCFCGTYTMLLSSPIQTYIRKDLFAKASLACYCRVPTAMKRAFIENDMPSTLPSNTGHG